VSSEHEASRHEAGGREVGAREASRPGSTVLARMIQRTREPRPSLEPVIQPLFAPRAGDFAPGEDPAPGALPPDLLPSDAPPPAVPGLEAFPLDAAPPRAPSPYVIPEAPDAPISELPERPVTSTPVGRRYQPGGRARASASDGGAPVTSQFPPPADGSGRTMEAFAADLDAGDGLTPGDGPALLAPAPPPRRQNLSAQRGYRSAAGVPADRNRAQGPSVTITIGHIEVRAAPPPRPPRVAAPPRPRPAFRPRTTLADFLDDGPGRPGGSGRR
jgi:hypothetical protein